MHPKSLIHSFLQKSVLLYPEKTAIVHGEERVSYRELGRRSECISQWLLRRNLQKGERVAILSDRPEEYVAAYFGILAAGGIAIGLNTQTTEAALKSVLSDSGCSVVLSQEKYGKYAATITAQPSVGHFAASIEALWVKGENRDEISLPALFSEDIAQIIYTSGTTGAPKGVMLRHRNLVANTLSIIEYLKLTEWDIVMAVLPFFYSYGNSVLLTHIAAGGTLVVNQSFLYPNVILDQMVAEGVTGFSGVPSSFAILLNRSAVRRYTFPRLRYITQAGAPMSPVMVKKLLEIFPGSEIFIMYGQTEAASRLSFLSPEMVADKPGSVGKAIPGVTLEVCRPDGSPAAIGEVGEVVATGSNIMAGYWQRPDETSRVLRNDRLWTGDLGRVDRDGYLFIDSRKSDIIKSGSHRIGPKEVEDVILELRGVAEVAVLGRDDEILGEKIIAITVLEEGCELTAKDIIRHCRRDLPPFKVPHEVVFQRDLPRTATGKIQRMELKKLLQVN